MIKCIHIKKNDKEEFSKAEAPHVNHKQIKSTSYNNKARTKNKLLICQMPVAFCSIFQACRTIATVIKNENIGTLGTPIDCRALCCK